MNAYGVAMLPNPSFTVEIPSIHDGLTLHCRIYHPASHSDRRHPRARPRICPRPGALHAAVLAHPYAPMGGCYDDPVVSMIGGQLLNKEFLVGTFNFRGAGCSEGRTSWTAKPERDDYASFVGFLMHYIHHLKTSCADDDADGNGNGNDDACQSLLLMGGYSYGAMITTHLAPLDELLRVFKSPKPDSLPALIAHEAAMLAGIAGRPPSSFAEITAVPHDEYQLAVPRAAYLLVSPPAPHGLVSALTTLSLLPAVLSSRLGLRETPTSAGAAAHRAGAQTPEEKLLRNRTLAVFGGADALVSVGKLRAWTRDLAARPGSVFGSREVESAGHFWSEEGCLAKLLEAVDVFVDTLLRGES